MATHRPPPNFQQAILYLLTAGSLLFSAYAELFPPIESAHTLNTTDLLARWPVFFLLIPLLLFVVSALLSRTLPQRAAHIALAAAVLGGSYAALRLCALLVSISLFIFLPLTFFTSILPSVLLYTSGMYAHWVLKAPPHQDGVIDWLMDGSSAGLFSRGVVLGTLVLTVIYVVWDVAIPTHSFDGSFARQSTEQHIMLWEDTSNSRCGYEVTFTFVDAYGYRLSTCSADLLTYLQAQRTQPVTLSFARTYSLGTWNYHIQQIGQFRQSLTIEGVFWSCSSVDPRCNQTAEFPLRQPYSFATSE